MKPNFAKSSLTIVASVLALAFTGSANAATLTWDGPATGGEFSTLANWVDSVTLTDPTAIASGDTMNINNGSTVDRSVNTNSGRTNVEGGSILNVTAGTQTDGSSGNTTRNFVGNGSTGTVNVSGGFYDVGHLLAIAHSNNSNGTVKVTGGTLNIGRGSNSLIGAYGTNFALGHSISIGGNTTTTNMVGLFEISGGELKTRTGVAVGNNGTFSQIGSVTTQIRLGGANADAGWFGLSKDGLWKAAIDGGGITPVFVEAQTNTSTLNPWVELQLGGILDLSFGASVTPYAGTWTLLELEGQDIVDSGLALAAGDSAAGWSFSVDNSGANGLIKATYTVVPEPSAAMLGGLGLFAILRRRRD